MSQYAEAFNGYVFIYGSLIVPVNHILNVQAVSSEDESYPYTIHISYDSFTGLGKEIAKKRMFSSIPLYQTCVVSFTKIEFRNEAMNDIAKAMKLAKENAFALEDKFH